MLVCTIVRGFKPYYAPKNFRFQVLRSLASEKGQRTAKVEAGASTSSGWPVSRVRTQFVDYFKDAHEHTNVISSPVVPVNDPTLLFANAGMNQFKSIFTGTVDPTSPLANLKSASEQVESITIWTMWAKTHTITRSLRCWAHGLLEIISRNRPSIWRGTCW